MPEYEAPLDGLVTVTVDGDRVTKFGASAGETIAVTMEPMGEDYGE